MGIPLEHLYRFASEQPDEEQRLHLLQEIDRHQQWLCGLDEEAQRVWLGLTAFGSDPDVLGGRVIMKIIFASEVPGPGPFGRREIVTFSHAFFERPDPVEGAEKVQAVIRSIVQGGFAILTIAFIGLKTTTEEVVPEEDDEADFIRRLARGETPPGWQTFEGESPPN